MGELSIGGTGTDAELGELTVADEADEPTSNCWGGNSTLFFFLLALILAKKLLILLLYQAAGPGPGLVWWCTLYSDLVSLL